MVLPKSLELKVADCKYRSVIDKCAVRGNIFFGCDKSFLSAMLVKLKVRTAPLPACVAALLLQSSIRITCTEECR